jgi:hypothetical protein
MSAVQTHHIDIWWRQLQRNDQFLFYRSEDIRSMSFYNDKMSQLKKTHLCKFKS